MNGREINDGEKSQEARENGEGIEKIAISVIAGGITGMGFGTLNKFLDMRL